MKKFYKKMWIPLDKFTVRRYSLIKHSNDCLNDEMKEDIYYEKDLQD